jgi:hypothetical protein
MPWIVGKQFHHSNNTMQLHVIFLCAFGCKPAHILRAAAVGYNSFTCSGVSVICMVLPVSRLNPDLVHVTDPIANSRQYLAESFLRFPAFPN